MHRILSFVILIIACCLTVGCHMGDSSENGSDADSLDLAAVPGMITTDVSMLVSDSGVLRYHAISPIWYRYNLDNTDPYWYFPEGIELNQLDNDLESIGKIQCDTAYNYERKQIWHLVGHVHVSNVRGEDFKTEELYWDMRKHTVYSDSFIHIERNRDILEGFGFNSNEQFTEYEIRQTTGIFEMRKGMMGDDESSDAPDDGEHLVENDEPGTQSPTTDTIMSRQLTPQEKAAAARQRRGRGSHPQSFPFDSQR